MTRWRGRKKGKILRRLHTSRSSALAVPAAVIGTIALTLTASPASAVENERSHSRLPAPAHRDTAPRAVPASTAPATHTVAAGDTVSAIAARYDLKTTDVLAWNALEWSSIIRPGQVLTLGGAVSPAPVPAASAPAAAVATHTVVGGETLWAIAQSSGVGLDALLSVNGLTRESIIYPGQDLAIPGAATPAAPAMIPATAASPAPAAAPVADVAPVVTLDAEQIANVRVIIAAGRDRGVSDRGIAVALATAMVESWIRNLDWGDRDSLGLFQQRPSQGWGTESEVRDAYRAAAAFYGGPSDPNGPLTRGLLDIPGWEGMEFGAVAQAVQRSAYPERYAPWESQATDWVAAYG